MEANRRSWSGACRVARPRAWYASKEEKLTRDEFDKWAYGRGSWRDRVARARQKSPLLGAAVLCEWAANKSSKALAYALLERAGEMGNRVYMDPDPGRNPSAPRYTLEGLIEFAVGAVSAALNELDEQGAELDPLQP